MSQAANSRQIVTGVDDSGEVPVEYRFSHAKNGNRHLLVVFANFAATDDYGWCNGILDKTQSNILWIRDVLDGRNTYYLCRALDFAVERSVAAVITRVMNALGLSPDACTMFGGSKGGSAALYFGLKYGFGNIVSVIPQFLVGSYVGAELPAVAQHMMGAVTDENVRYLDAVLPDLVQRSPNRRANIYVLSSPQDEQFPVQVEPFLALFQGYENFNLIFNDSVLIENHAKVTYWSIPTIMGLIGMLVSGIAPRIGMVKIGGEQPGRDTSAIDSYLSATSQIRDDSVFPRPAVLAPAHEGLLPENQVLLAGTAVGAVRVSLWENGKYLDSAPVAADGSWSWEPTTPMRKGRHAVRLFGVDPSNLHSDRVEVAFTVVDRTMAPAALPSQPNPPVVVSPEFHGQQGPAVQFTGFAPGAVQVGFRERGAVLGVCPVAQDGAWFWDAGWAWPEGPHAVELVALDVNGVESAPAVASFTVQGMYAAPRF
ncbi:hypothetical protein ABZ934_04475 [Streptomyces sp. NPDC046557]|uniref:hypothetical protein n=1 Tax=Streptomyces sp. NPDC046557 TaxID=3155372 RepID=UPI0033F0DBA5